jgi:hypothetical protein
MIPDGLPDDIEKNSLNFGIGSANKNSFDFVAYKQHQYDVSAEDDEIFAHLYSKYYYDTPPFCDRIKCLSEVPESAKGLILHYHIGLVFGGGVCV